LRASSESSEENVFTLEDFKRRVSEIDDARLNMVFSILLPVLGDDEERFQQALETVRRTICPDCPLRKRRE